MSTLSKGKTVAVGLLVVGLLAAFLVPVAVDNLNSDDVETFTQSENQVVEVGANLEANLTNVDNSTGAIDVTLNDTDDDVQKSVSSLSVGSNQTVSFGDGDVVVNNTANVDNTTATVEYTVPNDYGWGSGTKAIFGLISLFIILGIVTFFMERT